MNSLLPPIGFGLDELDDQQVAHLIPAAWQAGFLPSIQESLERFELDAVDLLLVHWPGHGMLIERQIELLNEARARGWTRHIGVSNYNATQLARAVEIHPFAPLWDQ